MSDGPATEVLDLAKVHAFYLSLLSDAVGTPVPVPRAVEEFDCDKPGETELAVYRRWLSLLDLAITPPAVRDALKQSTTYDTAEALLRYYFRKGSPGDREKADFVVTFLYRARQKNSPAPPTYDNDVLRQTETSAVEFEGEIYKVLGEVRPRELPPEHLQLVQEFGYLLQAADDFRHFDELMDSGILQKARSIKQAIGSSFYHPRVLAMIAVYNVIFGAKFDQLFHDAAGQIKTFAARVQQEGGSIMSRVEGDVMVKHLAEVEEAKLLNQEYGSALEDFRQLSKFKKAVDRRTTRAPAARPPAASAAAAAASAPENSTPGRSAPDALQPLSSLPQARAAEDAKTHSLAESIRNFLRTADRNILVVPLRNASLTLSPAEAESFRADFHGEKSFRADYAAHIMFMIGIAARFQIESADYVAKRKSAYLWKPHADALAMLITAAEKSYEQAAALMATCEQRGLGDKKKAMQATVDKLRTEMQKAAKLLQS